MAQLSDFDYGVIRLLREAGVLENEDVREIVMSNGVITIRCPDCDQKDDAERHDAAIAHANGGLNRAHPLYHHGGAAVASHDDILYPGRNIAGYLLLQIAEAEGIKNIHTIVAEVHAPCGKGADAGLTVVHLIAMMMQGKPDIKAVDPTNIVICRVHVDYGELRDSETQRRTYFISLGVWLTFWRDHGRELWGHLFEVDPHPEGRQPTGALTEDLEPARESSIPGNQERPAC
ncbi:MAG: hypothetical protein HQ488_05485 [Parcubacteria group bacterium]|nr:hypothetical protein [Parcubacteria group bacterium]